MEKCPFFNAIFGFNKQKVGMPKFSFKVLFQYHWQTKTDS